jgi:hypothetical protein
MMVAIVPGMVVWLVIAASVAAWLTLITVRPHRLLGLPRVAGWLLGAWVPRAVILIAWGAAGWHIFCQRP